MGKPENDKENFLSYISDIKFKINPIIVAVIVVLIFMVVGLLLVNKNVRDENKALQEENKSLKTSIEMLRAKESNSENESSSKAVEKKAAEDTKTDYSAGTYEARDRIQLYDLNQEPVPEDFFVKNYISKTDRFEVESVESEWSKVNYMKEEYYIKTSDLDKSKVIKKE